MSQVEQVPQADSIAVRTERRRAREVIVLVGMNDEQRVRRIDAEFVELREELRKSCVPLLRLGDLAPLTGAVGNARLAVGGIQDDRVVGVVEAQSLRESSASAM